MDLDQKVRGASYLEFQRFLRHYEEHISTVQRLAYQLREGVGAQLIPMERYLLSEKLPDTPTDIEELSALEPWLRPLDE
jgi:hypothetical protein